MRHHRETRQIVRAADDVAAARILRHGGIGVVAIGPAFDGGEIPIHIEHCEECIAAGPIGPIDPAEVLPRIDGAVRLAGVRQKVILQRRDGQANRAQDWMDFNGNILS